MENTGVMENSRHLTLENLEFSPDFVSINQGKYWTVFSLLQCGDYNDRIVPIKWKMVVKVLCELSQHCCFLWWGGFVLSLKLLLLVDVLPLYDLCCFLSKTLVLSYLLKWSYYLCFIYGTENFLTGCLNEHM